MKLVGVRILLIPTKEQEQAFYDSAYYSDLMYNTALQWNIDYYDKYDMFLSKFDMTGLITDFKNNHPEFNSVSRAVLNKAVTNLRTAFGRFRDSGSGFPRFKKIGKNLSFGIREERLNVLSNSVRIPSIGWVKCKHCHWLTRNKTDEQLKTIKWYNAHIKFDGKYWILTASMEVYTTPDEVTDTVIGIDLGIRKTMAISNGVFKENINNTRTLEILERRKKRLQRCIARKYVRNKQGNKYIKTGNIKRLEKRLRYIYRRLRYIRENYNQQITNEIIKLRPKRIMLEDLNINGMMHNKHLSRRVKEQCFYRIRQLLIEKALNTMTIQVGIVDRFYPSSKKCYACGGINPFLRSEETFTCPFCKTVIDRDFNAALNIRDCKDYKVVAN